MEKLYRQSNTMIWRDLLAAGYSIQHDMPDMDGPSSDSDVESDDSYISDYTDIDVNVLLGRAIAIWTYAKLDSLTLFIPRRGDSIFQITRYAEINLDFNNKKEKIMIMDPGEKNPKEVKETFTVRPGSVVMVMPKYNVNLNVEINQLKSKLPMSADLMCTVYEIKAYIKRMKGISIDQQDILYRDKALENSKRLFEYKIRNGSTMHVLIQVHFNLLVNIETFWGRTYRLYVDRCSTGSDLIYTVFGRTFSQYGNQQTSVHELFVPIHVLLLRHRNRSIHWNYCLGYFGVKNGDTLTLSTVGRHNNIEMQNVRVVTELGETHEISVSKFDRWSVVAFIMHGLTDVPVDFIRLFYIGNQMDFTGVIGSLPRNTAIVMNIMMNNLDKDLSFGIPLQISIGNGIVEHLKMAPMRTIKDVKKKLEGMGVPNANLYEITTGTYRLPKLARLQDVILDFNKTLHMKIEKFPVFLHAPDGIIYKTMVDVNHTMADLQNKFELKTGYAVSTCRMMVAGQELRLAENDILFENGFSTRTSVFVESSTFIETFFISNGDLLCKLKLPLRPTADTIKKRIWATQSLPEGSITCLQTFFFWFFYPRATRKYMLPKKRKSRKHIPIADKPLPQMSDRKPRKVGSYDDLSDIQIDLADNKYLDKTKLHGHTNSVPKLRKLKPIANEKASNRKPHSSYEPGFNRSNPTRVKRHRSLKELRPKQEMETPRAAQHMTPRWIGNLQQKDDANRLMAMSEDGMAYRQASDHSINPFVFPQNQSKGKRKGRYPLHNQGDASTATYFMKKPAYNRQQLYNSGSDSDSDEEKRTKMH